MTTLALRVPSSVSARKCKHYHQYYHYLLQYASRLTQAVAVTGPEPDSP